MPAPAQILRQEIPGIEGISDAPKVFKVAFVKIDAFPIEMVRKEVAKRYAKFGIQLSPEEMQSITVQGGVICSKYFGDFEEALGLTRDNKMDARLEAALKNPNVVQALKKHFNRFAEREATPTIQLAEAEATITHGVPRMVVEKSPARAL
jgi:hypothetical protein